jgi:tRNA threonylcarbamoyladenosine biosynthesis protein TsaE
VTPEREAAAARASASPEATERLGEELAAALRVGDVLVLEGPLGSGKTRFVVGLARGLGATGRVRSPSFGLIHEYPGRRALAHADLYRLTDSEAAALGLEELAERAVLAVEWGGKLPAGLRADALELRFSIESEDRRSIAAVAHGPRGRALRDAWEALA